MASKRIDTFVSDRLYDLEKSDLYRTLRKVVVKGPIATVDGREAVHLCSNDYLGLSQDRRPVYAAIRALKHMSQCSSRLIAGNDPLTVKLEEMLADHRKTEAALVYPTGYAANLGVVSALANKDCTILSDELNHASIIDACRLSGAIVKIFRHNDPGHLEELMKEAKGRKMVITEGVFSMDGDLAKLGQVCEIAQENDAMTTIDDAHGDFIFGPRFAGTPAKFRINADVHISSMSKGLGCFGGYVATSARIRELLINTSRQFIYTSALPDHLCAAAMAALPIAKKGSRQKKLVANRDYFTSEMRRLGFTLGASLSQIIPVMVGDEKKAMTFSKDLLDNGVFAQAVRYPTVKKGAARLRVSLTAIHEKSHLDLAVHAFNIAGKKSGVI